MPEIEKVVGKFHPVRVEGIGFAPAVVNLDDTNEVYLAIRAFPPQFKIIFALQGIEACSFGGTKEATQNMPPESDGYYPADDALAILAKIEPNSTEMDKVRKTLNEFVAEIKTRYKKLVEEAKANAGQPA